MIRWLPAVVAAVLLAATVAADAGANPFQSGRPASGPAPAQASEPGLTGGMAGAVASAQRWAQTRIAGEVERYKAGEVWGAVLMLMGLGFAYGAFHAAGPGHGKAVVSSWFLANRAHPLRGVLAGAIMAAGHTGSAVAIVVVLGLLLEASLGRMTHQADLIALVSYGVVTLIGLWLLRDALRGHRHCHGGHAHDRDQDAPHRGAFYGTFVAAGLTPCTGSIVLLLFTLANGVLALGLWATAGVALGMTATISAIGIAAIYARRGLFRLGSERARRAISVGGALLVVGVGGMLFLGALQRWN